MIFWNESLGIAVPQQRVEARLNRGHFYNGTSEQVTLGGRRHDVRLTSGLRFSMTVHESNKTS